MKTIPEMSEVELRDITSWAIKAAIDQLPPKTCVVLLFTPFGAGMGTGQYASNAKRDDIINLLRETADRLDRNEGNPR